MVNYSNPKTSLNLSRVIPRVLYSLSTTSLLLLLCDSQTKCSFTCTPQQDPSLLCSSNARDQSVTLETMMPLTNGLSMLLNEVLFI